MKSRSKKRAPTIVNLTVKQRYLTEREVERLMDCARKHGRRPAALPRAQEHPAHGSLYRAFARALPGLLEGLIGMSLGGAAMP